MFFIGIEKTMSDFVLFLADLNSSATQIVMF